MGNPAGGRYARDRQLLLWVYLLFYYGVFGFMALDSRLLAQVRPVLFNYNRDISELAIIAAGLPRWMIAHPWSFALADTGALLLPLGLLLPRSNRFAPWLIVSFLLFLSLYLLLADCFWQIHHEPFILYVLLPLVFLARGETDFYRGLGFCRYYFLYVFVSAAFWKIARGTAFDREAMSHILLVQHSDLLSGDCAGLRCRCYGWLITHPAMAQAVYRGGVLLEASFVAGLFTRRYDRLLAAFALLFVLADLWVMRIPYWTILLGTVTLWTDSRPLQQMIVVYETTHHENLPALLDLCETRFPRVIVFLKEVSYLNVTGSGSPASRWPNTQFIIQPEREPNRRFIRRLFRFVRRNRCSHLHLSTMDNNLLLFALRLFLPGGPHVSLTVHEVNEYFTYPAGTLRDVTESLAKRLLHRRIQHYSFFLPAMAARFRERMPDAVAVFLPSRFYSASPPEEKAGEPFSIVVPGSVDPNRRDYAVIADVFRTWPATAPPVRLVLLGDGDTPDGRDVVARLRELESHRFQLRYYKGYVPESIYEAGIGQAGVLWSPLRVGKKGSRNTPETYGQTTASGLTADLLLSPAPALVPADLLLPESFRTALLPYASAEEAQALLLRLSGDGAFRRRLRREIHLAFTYFVKENFRTAFASLTALDQEGEKGADNPIKTKHQPVE